MPTDKFLGVEPNSLGFCGVFIMWTDVSDLNKFYKSNLGQKAQSIICHRIRAMWPDVKGMVVAGVGYSTPFLHSFRLEAERVVAIMVAGQGAVKWPLGEAGLVALGEEFELPFPDLSVDRLLLVHAVESSEQLRGMMREAWRVLGDSGRLIIIVPNRRGIWARLDKTPFGFGHPYSRGQLFSLLRACMFTHHRSTRALYIPPVEWKIILKSAAAFENIGRRWFQTFGGVLLVEAEKEIYALTPKANIAKPNRRFIAKPSRVPFSLVIPNKIDTVC